MNSNEHDDFNFGNRLRLCILSRDNEKAQRILQEMGPSNFTDSSGKTLLHIAVESKNEIITKYLIDVGCKVDAADNKGDTPLILACKFDYSDIIKVLIKAKASVLISNNEGESAANIVLSDNTMSRVLVLDAILKRLREECLNDSLQTAKELFEARCSLTRAVRLRDTAITKYMLDNGCNVNESDSSLFGSTPLFQALVFEDNENAKLLIDHGADVNAESRGLEWERTVTVCHAADREILEIILGKGAKVVDDDGTLLAGSLFYSWEKEVVDMLMSRYNLVNLSMKDRDGTTLLHHLVSNREFDPVEILQKHFDYSFDINQKDHKGSTALFKAVKAGNVKTVEFLLKKGAKITGKEAVLDEVVYAVARNIWRRENYEDRERIMMLLLQYGADVQWSSRDDRGNEFFTLGYALEQSHFAMAKMIVAHLAVLEDLGGEIKNVYRNKIENTAMCKKYFEFSQQAIEKLKRTSINQRVTLFDFMTCSEETLIKFARSEEFIKTVQSIMYRKRNSNLYYYKVLRKRVKKAVEIVDLRKNISWYVNCLLPELQGNRIIIEKIVEYIIHDVLCFMAKQLTFKCIIDNE